jgi:hypothetical protein
VIVHKSVGALTSNSQSLLFSVYVANFYLFSDESRIFYFFDCKYF